MYYIDFLGGHPVVSVPTLYLLRLSDFWFGKMSVVGEKKISWPFAPETCGRIGRKVLEGDGGYMRILVV